MGTLMNVGLIAVGSLLGWLLKKRLSTKVTSMLSMALGVGVLLVGLSNTLVEMIDIEAGKLMTKNGLFLIVSLVVGGLIGTLLHLHERLESFEKKLANRFPNKPVTQGFIEASILYCVGAMAILGAFADGIHQDYSILLTKGIMDGISSLILVTTLGFGVFFSIVPVLLYQGALTLLAGSLAPFVTPAFTNLFSLVGFSLVFCIGLNMLQITKIKIVNLLPALLIPIVYLGILGLF